MQLGLVPTAPVEQFEQHQLFRVENISTACTDPFTYYITAPTRTHTHPLVRACTRILVYPRPPIYRRGEHATPPNPHATQLPTTPSLAISSPTSCTSPPHTHPPTSRPYQHAYSIAPWRALVVSCRGVSPCCAGRLRACAHTPSDTPESPHG